MTSVEEIIVKLEQQTGISKQELEKKINKKKEDLSGLVSPEGAAYLVARELGVNISNDFSKILEIKKILSGMKNVNLTGRVYKISRIVEFKRSDGSPGRVVNLYLSDGTGSVKLALWDKQVKLVEEQTIKLGDVIQVVNGFTKENTFGDVELSLGKYGSIKAVDNSELPTIEELERKFQGGLQKSQIKSMTSGSYEVQATIVNVFKSNFIFRVCSICGSKVEEVEGKFKCSIHGEVESNPSLVISTTIDDGTDNIRAVFFRNSAEKIAGIDMGEFVSLDQEKRYELVKERLMGKEIILEGRVRKNKMFDRTEMTVSSFKKINILEESNKLAKEIELAVAS